MPLRTKLLLIVLVTLIVVAHIGLWRDPTIPLAAKQKLTALNALGWAVIILPAIGVSYWLKAKTRKTDGLPPKEQLR